MKRQDIVVTCLPSLTDHIVTVADGYCTFEFIGDLLSVVAEW